MAGFIQVFLLSLTFFLTFFLPGFLLSNVIWKKDKFLKTAMAIPLSLCIIPLISFTLFTFFHTYNAVLSVLLFYGLSLITLPIKLYLSRR